MSVKDLEKRIRELEDQLKAKEKYGQSRQKIAAMSAEVVDSNPYR